VLAYVDIRPRLIGCDQSIRDLAVLPGVVLNPSVGRVVAANRHISAIQEGAVILRAFGIDYVANEHKYTAEVTAWP
jgi:hypothetical protein